MPSKLAKFNPSGGSLSLEITAKNAGQFRLYVRNARSGAVIATRKEELKPGVPTVAFAGDVADLRESLVELVASLITVAPSQRYSISMTLLQAGERVASTHESGVAIGSVHDVRMLMYVDPSMQPRAAAVSRGAHKRQDDMSLGRRSASAPSGAAGGPSSEGGRGGGGGGGGREGGAGGGGREGGAGGGGREGGRIGGWDDMGGMGPIDRPPSAARPPKSGSIKRRSSRRGIAPRKSAAKSPTPKPTLSERRLLRKAKKSVKRSKKPSKALPEMEVQREPHIDFHESVRAGETNTLTFRLQDFAGPRGARGTFTAAIPAGQESIDARVVVGAPGFDVKPSGGQPIQISREFDAENEKVAFQLTAREPGGTKPVSKEIRAEVWIGNSCVGAVMHHTNVMPTAYKGPPIPDGRWESEPFTISAKGRIGCDLLLSVKGKNTGGKAPFVLLLSSRIQGEEFDDLDVGELTFDNDEMAEHLQKHFNAFTKQHGVTKGGTSTKEWREGLAYRLQQLGVDLWDRLPKQFQDEYFRLRGGTKKPASILVQSDEMVIPWELITPHKDGKTYPALGAYHVMGRWRPGLKHRPPLQRLQIERGVIMNPQYVGNNDLFWALLEANDLQKILPPTVEVVRPATIARMRATVKRSDIQLLHYTGHGKYAEDDPHFSTLELEAKQDFLAGDLVAAPMLSKGGAMIYLNACGVGMTGLTVGEWGGFVAQCIKQGSCGIIAPYWPIADESAKAFSVEFYTRIAAGTPVGEALRDIRAKHKANPTFQAFTYYGDPLTLTRFKGSTAGAPAKRRRVG
jgi:hypothetical protein